MKRKWEESYPISTRRIHFWLFFPSELDTTVSDTIFTQTNMKVGQTEFAFVEILPKLLNVFCRTAEIWQKEGDISDLPQLMEIRNYTAVWKT